MKNIRNIKKISLAAALLLFWLAVLLTVQSLLMPKYQTGVVEGSMVEEYYRDKTKHDVLMVGDCEIYETFSTVELWDRYGITSYLRGSPQQLPWQSYYLLEDALRYEIPKVVVFNVQSLKYNSPQSEPYNRMTLDGMRWSSSKLGAIKASMTKDERLADYIFPLFRYHSRWSELTNDDFKHIFTKDTVTHNGYYMRVDVIPEDMDAFPDPMQLTDYTLGENAMSYLDKMTELCKENGIRFVLVKAPIFYPNWYDEWDRQIVDYAADNGLTYINFMGLREDIGLDMSVDTYDAGLHLNVYGAEKMSDYFGAWLAENCGLDDHRSDASIAGYYESLTENYNMEKESQQAELENYGSIVSRAPTAVKETNVLKNFIILSLLTAICLTLAACGTGTSEVEPSNTTLASNTNTTTAPEKEIEPPAADSYEMIYNDVEIIVGQKMDTVREKLGEPTKYFESASCAYQGLDKVFTYGSIVIRTFPLKDVDYVLSIELKDDMVATPEGICIGDSMEKVTETYGNPTLSTNASASYAKGGCVLSFIFDDGTVSAVTYMLIEDN